MSMMDTIYQTVELNQMIAVNFHENIRQPINMCRLFFLLT